MSTEEQENKQVEGDAPAVGETPAEPNMAERLGGSYVGIRSDLEVHRHVFQGVASYVLRDPITLECQHMNKKEYDILSHLTVRKSLSQIFTSLVEEEKLDPEHEEDFYQFVLRLHKMAFLNLPVSDNKLLYRRFLAKQRMRRVEKYMSFLFLRIPLFNPDHFLDRTIHIFRPFFHYSVMFVWLLMLGLSGIIISRNLHEIFQPLSDMFSAVNLVSMWLILILLKVFHEFGHAYACKSRGGSVPEMGIYMITLTPCAYVDVTSSWGFTRKRDRLLVGLAGVYIESFIAMIALFFWASTPHSVAGMIAHKVFFLASVVTLLMNVNPLMRFDGYYVFSDMVEVPNLRQKSKQYLLNALKRIFLGIRVQQHQYGPWMSAFMFVFGIASSLYKGLIILTISALISTKVFLIGLIMGGGYVLMILTSMFRRLFYYLWKSPESAPVRVRAVIYSIIILVGVPAFIGGVPIPSYRQMSGQVQKEYEHLVRCNQGGMIDDICFEPGDQVGFDAALVKLENVDLQETLLDAEMKLASARVKLASMQDTSDDVLKTLEQEEIVKTLELEYQHQLEKVNHLEVKAEDDGVLVDLIRRDSLGRYLKPGEPVGLIGGGRWIAKVPISAQDLEELHLTEGQDVEFRLRGDATHVIEGRVERVLLAEKGLADLQALTTLAGGDVIVDPRTGQTKETYYVVWVALDDLGDQFCYGMIGDMRLKGQEKTLGVALYRSLIRFTNNLYES